MPEHFAIVSQFCWDTMPNYRGADFFGFTIDDKIQICPGTFRGYYQCIQYRYSIVGNANGTATTTLIDASTQKTNNVEPVQSTTEGIVMGVSVPSDYWPPAVLAGSFASAYQYVDLSGAFAYECVVSTPSISPIHFNTTSSYFHKIASYTGSVSFSIPLGAAISITPSNKYSVTSDINLWTWNGVE